MNIMGLKVLGGGNARQSREDRMLVRLGAVAATAIFSPSSGSLTLTLFACIHALCGGLRRSVDFSGTVAGL